MIMLKKLLKRLRNLNYLRIMACLYLFVGLYYNYLDAYVEGIFQMVTALVLLKIDEVAK